MIHYEAITKDNTHMADSNIQEGCKSGNLLDNDSNRPNGTVILREITEEEKREEFISDNIFGIIGILIITFIGGILTALGIKKIQSNKKEKEQEKLRLEKIKQIQEEINNNPDKIIRFEEGKQELEDSKNDLIECNIDNNVEIEINDKQIM